MHLKSDDKRILVVEDDERSAALLKDVLESSGYRVVLASNGKEAQGILENHFFPVIITDLEMPEVGGQELIRDLKARESDAEIIVETCHNESEVIIDVMKNGVYDYLIKPIDLNELLLKVQRAVETAYLKKVHRASEKERTIRLENQLNWLKWMHERSQSGAFDKTAKEKALFYNLRTSLTQGSGFGQLISVLLFILESAQQNGDKYEIDKSIMDMVRENTYTASRIIDSLNEIDILLGQDIKTEEMTAADVRIILQQAMKEAEDSQKHHDNHIVLSENKESFKGLQLKCNADQLKRAIKELLLNAMKFSPKGTTISLLLSHSSDKLNINVLNEVRATRDLGNGKTSEGGIPLEYQNLVFEPFFRLEHSVFENFDTLDIGMGLNIVRTIVDKLGGSIVASNVRDYTDWKLQEGRLLVDFEVQLPLLSAAGAASSRAIR
ncbi:MAG: response regulator [Leptospiraceae bacterium]|nr:response regulator [Leptospiraceae bacterium]